MLPPEMELPVKTPPLNFNVGPDVCGEVPPPVPLPVGVVDIFTNGIKSFFGLPGPRRNAAAEGFPPPRPYRPTTGIVTDRTVVVSGPDDGPCSERGCRCTPPLLLPPLDAAVICKGSSSGSSMGEDWQVIGVVVGSRIASNKRAKVRGREKGLISSSRLRESASSLAVSILISCLALLQKWNSTEKKRLDAETLDDTNCA